MELTRMISFLKNKYILAVGFFLLILTMFSIGFNFLYAKIKVDNQSDNEIRIEINSLGEISLKERESGSFYVTDIALPLNISVFDSATNKLLLKQRSGEIHRGTENIPVTELTIIYKHDNSLYIIVDDHD